MRAYAQKVAIESAAGDFIRRVPAALASAMVEAGTAVIWNRNGKVRSIRLVAVAATHTQRIGEASAIMPLNTRFTRRVKTDNGASWIEFHPRSTYKLE